MSYCFHVIFQRLLVDCQATQHKIRFPQGQCIALDSIGVVSVLHNEFFRQPSHFTFSKRSAGIQLSFLAINRIQQAFS